MRYVESKLEREKQDLAYRIYITDCLKYLPEGKGLKLRYSEVIGLARIDNRTADEIAEDVIEKAGLTIDERI